MSDLLNITGRAGRISTILIKSIDLLSTDVQMYSDTAKFVIETLDPLVEEIDSEEEASFILAYVRDILHYGALTLSTDEADWASWAGLSSYNIAFEKAQRETANGFICAPIEIVESNHFAREEFLAQWADLHQLSDH